MWLFLTPSKLPCPLNTSPLYRLHMIFPDIPGGELQMKCHFLENQTRILKQTQFIQHSFCHNSWSRLCLQDWGKSKVHQCNTSLRWGLLMFTENAHMVLLTSQRWGSNRDLRNSIAEEETRSRSPHQVAAAHLQQPPLCFILCALTMCLRMCWSV